MPVASHIKPRAEHAVAALVNRPMILASGGITDN